MNDVVKIDDNDLRIKLQNFQTFLHKEPPKNEIKVNKAADNTSYIPISFLEMKLDEMFFGQWSTKNFLTQVIANEETGSLELWYLHPVSGAWLCRTGAAAVIIRQKKDSQISEGIGAKIKNALVMDHPHLKAECFRNACLSLGKAFGRDLNREYEDVYSPIVKEGLKIDEELLSELRTQLKDFSKYDELKAKSISIKEAYMKKGLPETTIYETIKARLDELK